jgi:hypothetical protein
MLNRLGAAATRVYELAGQVPEEWKVGAMFLATKKAIPFYIKYMNSQLSFVCPNVTYSTYPPTAFVCDYFPAVAPMIKEYIPNMMNFGIAVCCIRFSFRHISLISQR